MKTKVNAVLLLLLVVAAIGYTSFRFPDNGLRLPGWNKSLTEQQESHDDAEWYMIQVTYAGPGSQVLVKYSVNDSHITSQATPSGSPWAKKIGAVTPGSTIFVSAQNDWPERDWDRPIATKVGCEITDKDGVILDQVPLRPTNYAVCTARIG